MSTKFGGLIQMAALAIAFVIVFSIASNWILNPPTAIEVTECSLESKSVTSGKQTSISVTIESKDDENSHLVRIEFESHELVRFFQGSQLLPQSDGTWYYEYIIPPRATHTERMNVVPTLESGVSELKYRISVVVFSDGEEVYEKNLDLSVKL